MPATHRGGRHTDKYACLACRETRKRRAEDTRKPPDTLPCPTCGGLAYWMSYKFRSPRKADAGAWAVIERLISNGFRFVPVDEPYPTVLAEVDGFLARNADAWFLKKPRAT